MPFIQTQMVWLSFPFFLNQCALYLFMPVKPIEEKLSKKKSKNREFWTQHPRIFLSTFHLTFKLKNPYWSLWYDVGSVSIVTDSWHNIRSLCDSSTSQFQSPFRDFPSENVKDIGANLCESLLHVLCTNWPILVYEVTNLYLRRRIDKSTFRRFYVA